MSQIKVLFRNWVNLKGCSPEEFERIKKYAMKSTQADVLKLYRNTLTDIRFNAEVGIRKGVFNELQSIKNYYRSHGIIGKDFKEYAGLSSMLRRMGKISFRKDLDNLLKLIKDNNWSDEIVETIRNEYLLTKDDFNDILRDYIDKNFGWDYSEYREKFRFFANFSISYLKHYKIAIEFYEKMTNRQDKEKFMGKIKEIFESIREAQDLDLWIQEHNTYPMFLAIIAEKFGDVDPLVRDKIWKSFKKYYDAMIDCKTKKMRIDKARELHISLASLKYLAKIYATKVLKIDNTAEVLDLYKYNLGQRRQTLNRILSLTDEEEIFRIFGKENIRYSDLNMFVYAQNSIIPIEDRKNVLTRLQRLLAKYLEIKQSKKINVDYYQEFVNSEISVFDFCSEKGISVDTLLDKARINKDAITLNRIKTELAKYKEKENGPKKEFLTKEFEKLFTCIEDGITINGVTRSFDLIDYFVYFRHLDKHDFKSYIKDGGVIAKFLKPLKFCSNINEDTVRNSIHEVGCKKDEAGFPIPGTGRILRVEELGSIIEFMKDNGIPLYDRLVNIAIRRYIAGTLEVGPLQEMAR